MIKVPILLAAWVFAAAYGAPMILSVPDRLHLRYRRRWPSPDQERSSLPPDVRPHPRQTYREAREPQREHEHPPARADRRRELHDLAGVDECHVRFAFVWPVDTVRFERSDVSEQFKSGRSVDPHCLHDQTSDSPIGILSCIVSTPSCLGVGIRKPGPQQAGLSHVFRCSALSGWVLEQDERRVDDRVGSDAPVGEHTTLAARPVRSRVEQVGDLLDRHADPVVDDVVPEVTEHDRVVSRRVERPADSGRFVQRPTEQLRDTRRRQVNREVVIIRTELADVVD